MAFCGLCDFVEVLQSAALFLIEIAQTASESLDALFTRVRQTVLGHFLGPEPVLFLLLCVGLQRPTTAAHTPSLENWLDLFNAVSVERLGCVVSVPPMVRVWL